jgi:FMN phosphatase YigB (HAD superfamily)
MTSFLNKLRRRFFPEDLTSIKCLVWDVDGTLYQNTDQVFNDMCQLTIEFIVDSTSGDPQVISEHLKCELEVGKTLSQIVEEKYRLNSKTLADVIELRVDRSKYVTSNPQLVQCFEQQLGHIDHVILTNSAQHNAQKVLVALGIRQDVFKHFLSLEQLQEDIKPSLRAFATVHTLTGYHPSEHLMIGDSLHHDIIPAKRYGFKTCWVNQETRPPREVDILIHSPLELVRYFK